MNTPNRTVLLTALSLLFFVSACSSGGGDDSNSSDGGSSSISQAEARQVVAGLVTATNTRAASSVTARSSSALAQTTCDVSPTIRCQPGSEDFASPTTGEEVGTCTISCEGEGSDSEKISNCDFNSDLEFSTTCSGETIRYRLIAFDTVVRSPLCSTGDQTLNLTLPLEYTNFQAIVSTDSLDGALVECSGEVDIILSLSLIPSRNNSVTLNGLHCTIDGERVNLDLEELSCA